MGKASPALVTFDAGLLSPMLGARIDQAKYQSGCSDLKNFIPKVQGPAVRRGGTRYVSPVKNGDRRTWLVKFQVSETITYMLEFGHLYIRFYANRGQLVSGGVPVEIASPYTSADLTAEDGTCRIRVAQSADTMYIFHRSYKPRKLLRQGPTSFSLQMIELTGGPFQETNTNKSLVINVSGEAGSGSMSSNFDIFTPQHVGSLFYLETQDLSSVKPWAVHQRAEVNFMRRVDSRVYECTAVGTGTDPGPVTGNVTPTHTEGKAWDGDGFDIADDQLGPIGVEWLYLHSGYGVVLITGFTDGQHVNITVLDRIPADVVNNGTYKWAEGVFSDLDGWPEHGAFWRERLVLARDRRVTMSVSSDFENFSQKIGGEVTADSGIVLTLNARRINRILWLVESDDLIIGTNGDEWIVGPTQSTQPLGPANIRAAKRTDYGSKSIQPAEVGGRILFAQASGKKLRDYQYDYAQDNYQSSDTTKLSDNITVGARTETPTGGPTIVMSGLIDLTYSQEPDSVIWAARADGTLLGLTYDREPERSDVGAWHPHPLVNGMAESVESMPSPDGTEDDLWMIVRRVIDGEVVRYVEYLRQPLGYSEAAVEAFYVDCGLTYRGTPATTISGLAHLEGEVVDVLVDGATHPQQTVAGGQITLQNAGSIVHVGLPAPCALETMRLEAGAADGTAQGKTKRITNVVLRFHRSLGGKAGTSDSYLADIEIRTPQDAMDEAVPLLSGDTEPIAWEGGYGTSGMMRYENNQPLPVALLGIFPIVHTQDDR